MDNNQNNTTNTPISDAANVKAEEKVISPTAVPEPPSAPSGVGPIPVRPVNPTPQQMPASEEVKPEVKPVQDKVVSPLLNSDELISAYIGPNYDKIMKRPFNFAAFVFGSLYYFYRKMNAGGIIILIINALIAYFLKGYTICYALVGVHVLIGFITNRIYTNGAIRKINKLLIKYGYDPSSQETFPSPPVPPNNSICFFNSASLKVFVVLSKPSWLKFVFSASS